MHLPAPQRLVLYKLFRQYEQLTGKTFDKELKISAVLENAAADIRRTLLANIDKFETDYMALKEVLASYFRYRRRWTQATHSQQYQGPAPMDIGAVASRQQLSQPPGGNQSWQQQRNSGYGVGYGTWRNAQAQQSQRPWGCSAQAAAPPEERPV